MKNFSCCEKWLGRIFFMVAMSISSPAALPADDLSDAPSTVGLPSIPLSLEGSSLGQPSEQAGELAWSSETAFDWKAWAVVAGAGIVLVCIRLFSRRTVFKIPNDVFELLGEATLGGGQSVRVVRFGPKTLLVSVGSGGPKTLSELDDPLATEWIAAACRGEQTLRSLASPSAASDGSSDADVLQSDQKEDGSGYVRSHQSEVA
jgi:hypothetical protein